MQILVLLMVVACFGAAVLLTLNAAGVTGRDDRRRVEQRLAYVAAAPGGGSGRVVDLTDPTSARLGGGLSHLMQKVGQTLTPAARVTTMKERLNSIGNPPQWPIERVLAAKGAGLFVGAAAGFLFGLILPNPLAMLVAIVAGTAAGFFAPNMALSHTFDTRKKTIQAELPDTIDVLTIAVEAGLADEAALARVGNNGTGPLAQEIRRALQENVMGAPISDALLAMGQRSGVDDLQRFTSAIVQAKARGTSVGETLRIQSDEMRVKRTQIVEERAQKLQVKILVPLIFCILPTLFIVVLGPAVIQMMGAFAK